MRRCDIIRQTRYRQTTAAGDDVDIHTKNIYTKLNKKKWNVVWMDFYVNMAASHLSFIYVRE